MFKEPQPFTDQDQWKEISGGFGRAVDLSQPGSTMWADGQVNHQLISSGDGGFSYVRSPGTDAETVICRDAAGEITTDGPAVPEAAHRLGVNECDAVTLLVLGGLASLNSGFAIHQQMKPGSAEYDETVNKEVTGDSLWSQIIQIELHADSLGIDTSFGITAGVNVNGQITEYTLSYVDNTEDGIHMPLLSVKTSSAKTERRDAYLLTDDGHALCIENVDSETPVAETAPSHASLLEMMDQLDIMLGGLQSID